MADSRKIKSWRPFFFIRIAAGLLALGLWLPACVSPSPSATAAPEGTLPPIPTQGTTVEPGPNLTACTSPATPTVAMTEGPYFTAGSPERASLLETGMPGTRLVLSGSVLDEDCRPVAGALLDFWQANADGQYDNFSFTLRGRQYSDAAGRYRLTTVVPGLYPGRTEHIHVKIQAPGGPVLTTQLFFPGVAQNETDGIFDPSLVIRVISDSGDVTASFDFVIGTR